MWCRCAAKGQAAGEHGIERVSQWTPAAPHAAQYCIQQPELLFRSTDVHEYTYRRLLHFERVPEFLFQSLVWAHACPFCEAETIHG